ncbi:hypothetical protein HMPREF9214_0671 [Lactobacillus iners LactinV 11V1-d]|nr:hypothetical protein HMPREF9214_0671 [Lactobacillus iners LactinV 11V1-d]
MNKDSEEPIKHYERPSTPRGSVQKTSSAGNTKRRIRSVPSSTVAKRKSKRRSILVLATLVLLFLVCVPLVIAHFTSRSDNDSQKSELVHDRDSKDSHKKKNTRKSLMMMMQIRMIRLVTIHLMKKVMTVQPLQHLIIPKIVVITVIVQLHLLKLLM